MITVPTKDVGEVQDKFDSDGEYRWTLEEGNENYIKEELGIDGL